MMRVSEFDSATERSALQVVHGRWAWAVVVVLAIAWFGPLDHRALFRPDEGRYAEIPREMIVSGDWLTPRLNDLKYFEKPPLQYWATAAAYSAFGVDAWTARLWPAALGFLGLAGTLLAGFALFDRRTAIVSALLLASSLLYVLFAEVLTLDMGLTFFLTGSIYCFLLALRKGLAQNAERGWMLGAFAAAALAVMSKGLIGIVLPVLTLFAYLCTSGEWSLLRRVPWVAGGAVFLAIASPWFVLVQQKNPEFAAFFFINEHFARFMQPGHHRPGAWYYFIPVIFAGAMPWTSAVLPAMRSAWRSAHSRPHHVRVERFLLLWVLAVVGFFSLSSSKLPGYVLPAFPALALLMGRWTVQARSALLRRHLLVGGVVGLVLVLGALALFLSARFAIAPRELAAFAPWMADAGGVLALAFSVARHQLARERRVQALVVATLSSVMAFQLVISGAQTLAPLFSSASLLATARATYGDFDPGAPFYSVGTYEQTLPPDIGRPVTVVDYADELALGLRAEPDKSVQTVSEFRRRWHDHRAAYALMKNDRFEQEVRAGTAMEVMARDRRYVLVRKPAAAHIIS